MTDETENNSTEVEADVADTEAELSNREAADYETQTDETTDPTEDNPQDDGEDVEFEGKTYRVPKELKDGFMMRADHTRKTQELADFRKSVEAERQALAQRQEAQEALIKEHARVENLKQYVEYYRTRDWDLAQHEDPEQAQREYRRYVEMRHDLQAAETELQTKIDSRLKEQHSQREQALQETGRTLVRDIPGFDEKLAREIVATANQFGLGDDLLQNPDARAWKAFHALYEASRNKAKQATAERHAKQATTAPVKVVGAKSPPPSPLSDRASTDAWMKARMQQVRKG